MPAPPRIRSAAVVACLFTVAAACGSPGGDDSTTADPAPQAAPDVATPAVAGGTDTTTTTTDPTPATTMDATTTTLPGTLFDHPFIIDGSVLGVVGIAHDDTLSVHELPGPDQTVVGTLAPLASDIVASGRSQLVAPAEVYQEVTAAGVTGWVDGDHVLFIAGPRDITEQAISALGETPTAPTMVELGRLVVDALGPPPDAPSRVLVMVAAPSEGSTSEVMFDEFFGEEFGDDSIAGDRFRVTGRQVASTDLPVTGFVAAPAYELVRVELIGLCWRGATADEPLCV